MKVHLTWNGEPFEAELEQHTEKVDVGHYQEIGFNRVIGRLLTLAEGMCIPSEIEVRGETFTGKLRILPGGFLKSDGVCEWHPEATINSTLHAIRKQLEEADKDGRGWKGNIAGEDFLDEPVRGSDGKLYEHGHLTGKVTIHIEIPAHEKCPKFGQNHREQKT